MHAAGTLNLPLTVKEVVGAGSNGYPITAVVPLPKGIYNDVNSFRVVDLSGNTVPAQFDVLNRWWFQDNSIRHLSIKFQPFVGAFTAIRKGISTYYLRDNGSYDSAQSTLNVKDMPDYIKVVTGPLKFTVSKKRFNLIDELWLDQNNNAVFEDFEKIINSSSENGGIFVSRLPEDIQFDSSRSDIKVIVEESGPMRVVIRANALTKYYNTSNHIHGFAVRIYAYANKPFVKVDYQLQNSAKNKKHAWPLYFEEMRLDFHLNLDSNPTVRVGTGDDKVYKRERRNGLYFAKEFHDTANIYDMQTNAVLQSNKFTHDKLTNRATSTFLDVSDSKRGVTAMIRYMWQTWPNGLAVNDKNILSIQLFPNWSAQWFKNDISSTGLYWLEDMQHVYKETLLYFHGTKIDDEEIIQLAKTFQYPPVVTLPTSWYQETKASLDMGGLIPLNKKKSNADKRYPTYKKKYFNFKNYRFNWDNFFIISRKWDAAQGGGWPLGAAQFIATENPSDYYFAEQLAIGELNIRPHWIAGYNHEHDYKVLRLNYRLPFIARSWRRHNSGNKPPYLDASYLQGTYGDASPRDNAHGWYYHVEEAYYFTANPWIRDWYEFIGELRKSELFNPGTGDISSRGNGHMISNALQAYRVTGDTSILDGVRYYINTKLIKEQNPYFGYRNSLCCGKHGEAAFQAGYLLRALISFMEEVREKDWQAYSEVFQFVSGYMEWNYNLSNFSSYIDARKGAIGKSKLSAFTFVDPQAWFYLRTGKQKYLNHLIEFIDNGINGGKKPSGNVKHWKGQFEGRYGQYVLEVTKDDTTPPSSINDLKALRMDDDMISLVWTAPQDVVRYHVVYSNKPISENMTTDRNLSNWWSAKVIGTDLVVKFGEQQMLTIKSNQSFPLYFAVFSFDEHDNMSSMSNVALLTLPRSDL